MENTELETLRIERDAAVKTFEKGMEIHAKFDLYIEVLNRNMQRVRELRRANRKREAWALIEECIDSVAIMADVPPELALHAVSPIVKELIHGR